MSTFRCREARRLVPTAEFPSEKDLQILSRQIGRQPQGVVFVASRCERRKPRVMLTLPSLDSETPFPSIFWLTCPYLSRAAAGLEGSGFIKEMERKKEGNTAWRETYERDETRFVRLLEEMVDLVGGDTLRERMGRRGIAGGKPGLIKCLHAHLAYYLVTGKDPVGRDCWRELTKSMGESCEEVEKACRD